MSTSKGRSYYYEAMCLVPQTASTDLNGAVEHISAIIAKSHGRIVAIKKWDERRLAFEINKQKRGIYILAYFQADPVNLAGIERDFNLSEQVLRALVVRADHLTEEEMIAADARQLLQDEGEIRRGRPDEMVPEYV